MGEHHRDPRAPNASDDALWLPTLAAAVLGVALIALARWDALPGWLSALLDEFGALALAAIAFGWFWEWRGKRKFLQDVLDKVRLSADVLRAGITAVGDFYLEQVDWEGLFASASKIDIAVAYGRTWRNNHLTRLEAFVRRPRTRLRVVLPDPHDEQVLAELSRRFVLTPAEVAASIEEAAHAYLALRANAGPDSVVEVYFRDGTPTYAYYAFDDRRVVTLYNNRRERGQVPTFSVLGGTLGQFLYDDFAAMVRQSTSADLSQGRETMSSGRRPARSRRVKEGDG